MGAALLTLPAHAEERIVDGRDPSSCDSITIATDTTVTAKNDPMIPSLSITGGNSEFEGDLTVNNTFTMTGGTANIVGGLKLLGNSTLENGTLTISSGGIADTNPFITKGGNFNVLSGGIARIYEFTMTGGAARLDGAASIVNTFSVEKGQLVIGSSGSLAGDYHDFKILDNGYADITGKLAANSVSVKNGTLTVSGSSGSVKAKAFHIDQGAFSLLSGASAESQSFALNSGKAQIAGSVTVSVGTLLSGTSDLKIDAEGTANTKSFEMQGGSAEIAGALTVTDALKLEGGVFTVSKTGSADVGGLNIGSGEAQLAGKLTVRNITELNGSKSQLKIAAGAEAKTKSLQMLDGRTEIAGALTVDRELTVWREAALTVGSTGSAEAGSLTLRGTATIAGSLTVSGNTELDGTSGGPAKLEIAKGARAKTKSLSVDTGTADVSGSLTVDDRLDLSDGVLTVSGTGNASVKNLRIYRGSFDLEMGGAAEAENLTLDGGSADIKGKLTISDNLSVESGSLTVDDTGRAEAEDLDLSGGTVQVIGKLTLNDKLSVTGGTMGIDDIAAVKAGDLALSGGSVLVEGKLTAGRAGALTGGIVAVSDYGVLSAGTDDESWLIRQLAANDPDENASVALGLYAPLTLSGTQIILDSAYNPSDTKYSDAAFYAGDKSAIVVNAGALNGMAALTAPAGSTFKAEGIPGFYLVHASAAGEYKLLSGFTGGIVIDGVLVSDATERFATREDAEDAWLFVDNVLLRISSSTIQGGELSVVLDMTSLYQAEKELHRYAPMVDSFLSSGSSGGAASELIDVIFSRTFDGTALDKAAAIESAASFGSIAAGPALSGARQAENAVSLHLGERPDRVKGSGVWAVPYASRSDVSGMSAGSFLSAGWESKNYGVVVGWDRQHERGRIGAALHVGKSDIEGSDVFSRASGDGKYLGGMLYGDWDFGSWKLEGDVGYGTSKTDLQSHSIIGALSADGVDAKVFSAGASAVFTAVKNDGFALRPFAGIRFTRYDQDAYSITKGGETLFCVNGADMNLWNFSLGLKFDWQGYSAQGWDFKPTAQLAYIRAAGDTELTQNVRMGSGTVPSALGVQIADDNAFSAGIGVTAKKNNFSTGFELKGLFSENQKNYGINATFRWEL